MAEGLDLLGTGPACVILDLLLSDGDGAAVLRQIRDDGLDIRVVVCSRATGVTGPRSLPLPQGSGQDRRAGRGPGGAAGRGRSSP